MEIRFMNQRALKTYVFYCSNNLASDPFASLGRDREGDTIKTISLPVPEGGCSLFDQGV